MKDVITENYQLMFGDCLERMKEIPSGSVDLVLTDPPYVKMVSENFKSYEYFYEWCNNQLGFNSLDAKGKYFDIDKDLLIKNNKTYSEIGCVFIPHSLNTLLVKSNSIRGEHLIGVCHNKKLNKYQANIKKYSKLIYMGLFDTELDAFNAYKVEKELYVKELAQKYQNDIDERAYVALLNYKVDIND